MTVSGTEVATIDVPTIAPDATADIPVTFGLGTTQTGNVDIKMEVTITGQTDGNTADNTATASIEVTETVLAYDHTTPDMYNGNHVIGVGDENYNFVAAIPIHITNDDVLTGISVGWGATKNQEITLAVYKYDPDVTEDLYGDGYINYRLGNQILSTTAQQGTETGQIDYEIPPRALVAGDYMLCVGLSGYNLVTDFVAPGYLFLVNDGYAIDQSMTGLGSAAIRAISGEGEPIACDLIVDGIISPSGEGLFAANQPITVRVTNNGSEAALGSLEVTVNGNAIEAQTVKLDPYTSADYTFEYDMSVPGDYTIVATATIDGDENPDNNSSQVTVTSIEPLDPYVMDFEGCADFATENFNPAWKTVDGDGAMVYTMQGVSFPVPDNITFAFMAFNPAKTTPEMTGTMTAYSGERFGASFASTAGVNDDWLISPLLKMPSAGASMSMQVKSYDNTYGLEEYEVCISTTNDDPSSFTMVASGEAPADDWEEVTVDLSDYAGQDVYVAIHCVSQDVFIFMVDDIKITKPTSGIDDVTSSATLKLYPNPASDVVVISAAGQEIEAVNIYSTSGALVGNINATGSEARYNVSGLPSGVYFARIYTSTGSQVIKFMVK